MTNILKDPRRLPTLIATLAVFVIALLWLGPLVRDSAPNRLVQSAITGLLVGGIYSLVALGIVVINKASGVFNFAHGGMMMVAGFIFFSFFTTSNVSLPFALIFSLATVALAISLPGWRIVIKQPRMIAAGIAAVIVLTFVLSLPGADYKWIRGIVGAAMGASLLGLAVERFTIRPLIGQPLFASVMMTLAVAQILAGTTQLVWGSQPQSLLIFTEMNPIGLEVKAGAIRIDATALIGDNISIESARLYAFGLALVAFLVFGLLVRYARTGLAMRATSKNQVLVQSIGFRVRMLLVFALAIAALLAGIAGMLFGGALSGGNISIERTRLYAFGLALVAFLAFWLFFRYTSVGLAMRATSENQVLAQSIGVRVRMILAIAWAIAALLGGVAGILYGGSASLDTNMQYLALRAFPAVLLGGIESIGGALVGGLAIGLTEEYSKLLFSGDVGEQLAPYVVLMVVLILRPEGLFGQKRIDRI